jgi:hypothetical protein
VAHPVGCHPHSKAQGRFHIARVGKIASGNIKGGAVVYRHADDGKTQRDVYRVIEGQKLHGDVSLVVIHRYDKIVISALGLQKGCIRRGRAGAKNAVTAGFFDGWADDLFILGSEEAVFSGMWIQAADDDARLCMTQYLHCFISQANCLDNSSFI